MRALLPPILPTFTTGALPAGTAARETFYSDRYHNACSIHPTTPPTGITQ